MDGEDRRSERTGKRCKTGGETKYQRQQPLDVHAQRLRHAGIIGNGANAQAHGRERNRCEHAHRYEEGHEGGNQAIQRVLVAEHVDCPCERRRSRKQRRAGAPHIFDGSYNDG